MEKYSLKKLAAADPTRRAQVLYNRAAMRFFSPPTHIALNSVQNNAPNLSVMLSTAKIL